VEEVAVGAVDPPALQLGLLPHRTEPLPGLTGSGCSELRETRFASHSVLPWPFSFSCRTHCFCYCPQGSLTLKAEARHWMLESRLYSNFLYGQPILPLGLSFPIYRKQIGPGNTWFLFSCDSSLPLNTCHHFSGLLSGKKQ
jgi:hypothetical protein